MGWNFEFLRGIQGLSGDTKEKKLSPIDRFFAGALERIFRSLRELGYTYTMELMSYWGVCTFINEENFSIRIYYDLREKEVNLAIKHNGKVLFDLRGNDSLVVAGSMKGGQELITALSDCQNQYQTSRRPSYEDFFCDAFDVLLAFIQQNIGDNGSFADD